MKKFSSAPETQTLKLDPMVFGRCEDRSHENGLCLACETWRFHESGALDSYSRTFEDEVGYKYRINAEG